MGGKYTELNSSQVKICVDMSKSIKTLSLRGPKYQSVVRESN